MEKNYKTLELDKVLEMLKAETSCEDAGELALSIKPSFLFASKIVFAKGSKNKVVKVIE